MKKRIIYILLIIVFINVPLYIYAQSQEPKINSKMARKERLYIIEGNKLYNDKKYSDAEVVYRKAMEANPASQIGQFNLANSLIRQAISDEKQRQSNLQEASGLLSSLYQSTKDANIASKAAYSLGNISYMGEQYEQSIEMYKNALRKNPKDDEARYNLRMAQLKLKNQQQNKDKNKDNKDNKDKQKQDQNKDKKDQDKKDQQKQNQDQQKQNQDKKDQKQQQPQQGDISKDNIDQILKAAENNEKNTQQKINAMKNKSQNQRRGGKQW